MIYRSGTTLETCTLYTVQTIANNQKAVATIDCLLTVLLEHNFVRSLFYRLQIDHKALQVTFAAATAVTAASTAQPAIFRRINYHI